MTITSAGNVGIGTAAPGFTLEVNGTAKIGGVLTHGTYDQYFDGATSEGYIGRASGLITGSPAGMAIRTETGSLYFSYSNTPYMTLNSSGYVGIGTTNPSSLLTVGSGTFPVAVLAGINVATGNNSYITVSDNTRQVFLGADSNGYGMVGTLSNHDLVMRTNNTERMRITNAGNVGIGGGGAAFQLNGLPSRPAGQTVCYGTGGSLYTNDIGYCSSDARLKNSIAPIAGPTLDAVLSLNPATFRWNGDAATTYAGFIAQDVQKTIPLAVRMQPNGYYALDTNAIAAYLAGAIKELKSLFDGDHAELAKLKADNDNEATRNDAIESELKAANDNIHHLETELTALKVAVNRKE
jgi:endosialidase-like protein